MGNCVSMGRRSRSRGVLVLGLDGAGTTTILYQLVLGKRLETIPTLGVNHEKVQADGLQLDCWDVGGLDKVRPLWRQCFKDADAVIFVVDSTDLPRMRLAAEELAKLYRTDSSTSAAMKDRPLLVFANKQDLRDAASIKMVEKVLRIEALNVTCTKVLPSSANDRQSLVKGVQWLTAQLKKKKPVANRIHAPSTNA
ncbi:ADP-ribosylation factor [Gracilariopsis chorda]|uniref:ADP-ribosylation factor n=1 Tax=Gracilariopsis chorda TaxID=448386 RepID=A0A2V3IL58_9FLOR|nr:ADP-ribosylation factor [Gracilariopsis chorda]|eukprot:PXF42816.1 ADP-ribosylation factor [Gracilariopsis chorda]